MDYSWKSASDNIVKAFSNRVLSWFHLSGSTVFMPFTIFWFYVRGLVASLLLFSLCPVASYLWCIIYCFYIVGKCNSCVLPKAHSQTSAIIVGDRAAAAENGFILAFLHCLPLKHSHLKCPFIAAESWWRM